MVSWYSIYDFFLLLTFRLAQGKNMPKVNKPNNGPPTMPKMLRAAWKENERWVWDDLLSYFLSIFSRGSFL